MMEELNFDAYSIITIIGYISWWILVFYIFYRWEIFSKIKKGISEYKESILRTLKIIVRIYRTRNEMPRKKKILCCVIIMNVLGILSFMLWGICNF